MDSLFGSTLLSDYNALDSNPLGVDSLNFASPFDDIFSGSDFNLNSLAAPSLLEDDDPFGGSSLFGSVSSSTASHYDDYLVADSLCEADLFQSFASAKNFAARNKVRLNSSLRNSSVSSSGYKTLSVFGNKHSNNSFSSSSNKQHSSLSGNRKGATSTNGGRTSTNTYFTGNNTHKKYEKYGGRVSMASIVNHSPKVYISPSTKRSGAAAAAGTSILLKSKRSGGNSLISKLAQPRRSVLGQPTSKHQSAIKYNNNKNFLQGSSSISKGNVFQQKSGSKTPQVVQTPNPHADHDYCVVYTEEMFAVIAASNLKSNDNSSSNYLNFLNDPFTVSQTEEVTSTGVASATSLDTQVQNDLEDILDGFIPDDVLLNELPNCLQDLFDLDLNSLNNVKSEDVLDGLNDVCNMMADNYFDDLEEELYNFADSMPNLELTEDDINAVIEANGGGNSLTSSTDSSLCGSGSSTPLQSSNSEVPGVVDSTASSNCDQLLAQQEAQFMLSPFTESGLGTDTDAFSTSSASVISSEDNFANNNNKNSNTTQINRSSSSTCNSKSKCSKSSASPPSSASSSSRRRNLSACTSSQSSGNSSSTRRKRRFSSRSSVNSSDSMGSEDESSASEAASSRCSSPDPHNLGLLMFHVGHSSSSNKKTKKNNIKNTIYQQQHQYLINKNRQPRKNVVNWSDQYMGRISKKIP